MDDIYLKYTGDSFIFGVPARDLTEAEARSHGVKRLLESGLYEKADKAAKPEPKRTAKTEVNNA